MVHSLPWKKKHKAEESKKRSYFTHYFHFSDCLQNGSVLFRNSNKKQKKKGKSNYWAEKKKSKIALSFTCSLSRSYWSGSVCHATKGWSETVFLSVNQMQIQEISPSSCHRSEQMLMQRPRGVLRTGMLQPAFLEDTAVPQDSFLTALVGLCRCWWNHWGIELPMLCNPPHAVTVVSLKIS